jgi:hypothetical protein
VPRGEQSFFCHDLVAAWFHWPHPDVCLHLVVFLVDWEARPPVWFYVPQTADDNQEPI